MREGRFPRRQQCRPSRLGVLCVVMTLVVLLFGFSCAKKPDLELDPDWAKDLVIYEIATRGFTSPSGPESGTFNGILEKLPYLEELGINAIWVTGHSLADPNHFYGIWTQYACIEPGRIDPALGTEADFRNMVSEAHRRGIRVILDTIEHGVMNESPLITEHPNWFKGGSWGMTDYDWDGNHPDLDEWWVTLWTKAVLDWGVDGFRCDCGLHRPDLWLEIKRRCAAAGKPIFVLGESGAETVSDACQRDIMLFNQRRGLLANHAVLTDLAAVSDLFHTLPGEGDNSFICEIVLEDGETLLDTGRGGPLTIKFLGIGDDLIGTWERSPDGRDDWTWSIEGLAQAHSIERVFIACPNRSWSWRSKGGGWQLAVSRTADGLTVNGGDPLPGPKLRIISPSCHDCGWDGFPADKNPYSIQGSRAVFGYGVLFAPAIPVFMSGEEFDAAYRPLPGHTPGLFGEGEPGTGTWLYGSWLQWGQLTVERHRQMYDDVKRMLTIRREHMDLIHAIEPGREELTVSSIPAAADEAIPVPYLISNGKRALLIAGNPTGVDLELDLKLTCERLGFPAGAGRIEVTRLWPVEVTPHTVATEALLQYHCLVPADHKQGGGLAVIRFDLLSSN
jgi:Alpha amylase, catalytic domain